MGAGEKGPGMGGGDVGPGTSSGDETPGRDRTAAPEPGPIRTFHFPEVVSSRTDSGLDLRVARMSRLPAVSANLVLALGEASLRADHAGLAVLAGEALEGGTEVRSGSDLAEALEGIGAQVRVAAGWDATNVSLSCLADRLDEALELVAEMVTQPSFPSEEVERARNQHLARIRQRAMDPGSLASDEAARLFYAAGVPYARPVGGTEETVRAMGRDRIRGFVDGHYRPDGGGFVVAGDVDPGEVEEMVSRHFAGWKGAPPVRPDVDAVARSTRRQVHVVHRPGSVQSELRIGHPGAPRGTPDYFPLSVANTVLGGAFTSRLNLNLREEHGFTYGVRSSFSFRRGAGPFHVAASVGTKVTADAVREAMGELQKMVDHGPTPEEVRAARDYMAGVFPLRLETSGQVSSRLAELVVYGLSDDWHARYRDRVRAVDAATATEAMRRHVRPHEAQIVVVGDAEQVVAPLEALELGPVTVHGGGA